MSCNILQSLKSCGQRKNVIQYHFHAIVKQKVYCKKSETVLKTTCLYMFNDIKNVRNIIFHISKKKLSKVKNISGFL